MNTPPPPDAVLPWIPSLRQHKLATVIATASATTSLFYCLSILCLAFVIYRRGSLSNRASLILMLVSLVVLVVHATGYIIINNANSLATCAAGMWMYQFTTIEMTCLVFHMLINLILGIYSSKYARYRLLQVVLLFLLISAISTSLWQLLGDGYIWFADSNICWFKSIEKKSVGESILETVLPGILITVGMIVMLGLISHKVIWSRDVQSASRLHDQLYQPFASSSGGNMETDQLRSSIVISSRPLSTAIKGEQAPCVLVARLPTVPAAVENQYYSDRRQLRQMIFRISAFPLIYVVILLTVIALRVTLRILSGPDCRLTDLSYNILYFLDLILPTAIPWCGALCATFADPTLSQAIMKFLFPSYTVDQGFDLEDQKTRFANELLSGGPGVSKQTMVNVVEEDELEFSETPKTHIVEVAEEKPSNHKSLEKNLASFAYKENMTTLDVVAEVEEG